MKTHDAEVAVLVDKAAKAPDSNDSLKFSQAALNVANAAATLATTERESAGEYRTSKGGL